MFSGHAPWRRCCTPHCCGILSIMSAIASATLVRKCDLERLADAAKASKTSWLGKPKDVYAAFIAENGRALADYSWSGYVLATVLCYLDGKRETKLMKSEFDALSKLLTTERRATHFVLTEEHKQWLATLASENFSEDELKDYFNDFNDASEDDIGRPMLDGIRFLRDALMKLDADSVVILAIG